MLLSRDLEPDGRLFFLAAERFPAFSCRCTRCPPLGSVFMAFSFLAEVSGEIVCGELSFPPLTLRNVPRFRRRVARSTSLLALSPYLRLTDRLAMSASPLRCDQGELSRSPSGNGRSNRPALPWTSRRVSAPASEYVPPSG